MTWKSRRTFALPAVALAFSLVVLPVPGATATNSRPATAVTGSVGFPGLKDSYVYTIPADGGCGAEALQYRINSNADQLYSGGAYFIGSAKITGPNGASVGQAGAAGEPVNTALDVAGNFCKVGTYRIVVNGTIETFDGTDFKTLRSVQGSRQFNVSFKKVLYTPRISTTHKGRTLTGRINPSCGKTLMQKLVGRRWTTKKTFYAKVKCIDHDRVLSYKATSVGKWRFVAPATKYSRTTNGKALTVR